MNPKKVNTLDKEQVEKISCIHSSFWHNTIRLKLVELAVPNGMAPIKIG